MIFKGSTSDVEKQLYALHVSCIEHKCYVCIYRGVNLYMAKWFLDPGGISGYPGGGSGNLGVLAMVPTPVPMQHPSSTYVKGTSLQVMAVSEEAAFLRRRLSL